MTEPLFSNPNYGAFADLYVPPPSDIVGSGALGSAEGKSCDCGGGDPDDQAALDNVALIMRILDADPAHYDQTVALLRMTLFPDVRKATSQATTIGLAEDVINAGTYVDADGVALGGSEDCDCEGPCTCGQYEEVDVFEAAEPVKIDEPDETVDMSETVGPADEVAEPGEAMEIELDFSPISGAAEKKSDKKFGPDDFIIGKQPAKAAVEDDFVAEPEVVFESDAPTDNYGLLSFNDEMVGPSTDAQHNDNLRDVLRDLMAELGDELV